MRKILIYIILSFIFSNISFAKKSGCRNNFLVSDINSVDWKEMEKFRSIGLTASASAPEILINEFLKIINKKFKVEIRKNTIANENITFKLPKELRE